MSEKNLEPLFGFPVVTDTSATVTKDADVVLQRPGEGLEEAALRAVNEHIESALSVRHRHLEMLAAAYLLKTDIPPDEAMLVERTLEDGVICWCFQRKK